MKDNNFYDIKNISFADRESFNNTILLLTLVKSDFYYITGFNRPQSIIEIAFDFESEYYSKLTEKITINFDCSDQNITLNGFLQNVCVDDICTEIVKKSKFTSFYLDRNIVKYESNIDKDAVVPVSVRMMNKILLKTRNEILAFLEDYYSMLLCL